MAGSQETATRSLASLSTSAVDPQLSVQQPSSPKKRFRSPDPIAVVKSISPSSALHATGISEMAEAKRRKTDKESTATPPTSKNPAAEALNALSGTQATSKASDVLDTSSATTPAVAPSISLPENGVSSAQTSPTTVGSVEGLSSALNGPQVTSPGALDQDTPDPSTGNKAFSYPGPMLNAQSDAKRGMSLPGSTSQNTKSPATNKKHKCPYCNTEFTRHHNLKSHLLTHSHEKPFLCETCDSRFRRLHDLKRHTKLHTGERPHTCPICHRKFARGDALARHAKGPGGCAGRRSSVGDYVNEGDAMEGMVYTDGQSHEPENMEEDEASGSSLPSIRHHAPAVPPYRSETSPIFSKAGSTYPPIAARANMGSGLHPPGQSHPSSAPGGGQYPGPYQQSGSGGVFPTSQMTESPKPLSPRNAHPGDLRDRTSSMGQGYGRRGTRNTPPPSLPPPAVATTNQLPSLPGLAPPDSRFVLHSTGAGPGPSPTLPHPNSGTFPPHSASNSLSSHGTGHHGSGERGNMAFTAEERLWAVIKGLEAKVERLEDEVRMLRSQQISPSQIAPPGSSLPPPNR